MMVTRCASVFRRRGFLVRSAIAVATLFLFGLATDRWAHAEESAAYREAFAVAVRAAANQVLASVVTVESITGGDAKSGEVLLDAPTSGLLIDPDGYLLTSSLPVQAPGAALLVTLPGGDRATATLVARDFHRELALLKIETTADMTLDAVELSAEAPDLAIGQTTIAVGRYGATSSPMVSSGILSAVKRLDGIALQTDARISPTFYGGPLIDLRGRVLGILIPAVGEAGAENPTDWYDSGVAFAIDSATLAKKLDRLKSGIDIKRGLMGIVTASKDPNEKNTTLSAVRPRSPAESAGILTGDVVRRVAGVPVDRYGAIKQVLGQYDAGETLTVEVDRGDQRESFEITLAESIPPLVPQRLGVIAGLDQENEDDGPRVVVEALIPGTPAAESFQQGDVIQRIGRASIDSVQTLRSQLITAAPETKLDVTVIRDGESMQSSITPESQSAGPMAVLPESLENVKAKPWKATNLKLPEAATEAALIGPAEDAADPAIPYGLAVLLAKPGETDAMKLAEVWTAAAARSGTIVVILVSENQSRWQLKELEMVRGMMAAAKKRFRIAPTAVAIAPHRFVSDAGASAADTMALAAGVSMPESFSAVAIAPETTPPAIRLRENEASKPQQILLRIDDDEELPTFASILIKTGYPIVRGGKLDREEFLSWIRLTQAI